MLRAAFSFISIWSRRLPISSSAPDVARPPRLSSEICSTSSSSSPRTGSIWFSSRPRCRSSMRPSSSANWRSQSCRESPPRGAPPRSRPAGALPQPRRDACFRRFSTAARLGKLGLAHGLHLLHFTSPLLGGGGGAALRLLRFRLTPCLGKLGLPARLSHFGLAFRFGQLRLPPDLGHLVAPALLGRLRLAPRLGDLRRDLRQPPFFLLGRILRLAADELRFATRFLGAQPRLFRIPRARSASRLAAEAASSSRDFSAASSAARRASSASASRRDSASCALRSASVGTEALVRGGLNAGDGAAEAAEEGDARCCRRRPNASRRASSRSRL